MVRIVRDRAHHGDSDKRSLRGEWVIFTQSILSASARVPENFASEHTTLFLLRQIRGGDNAARTALIARIEPLLRRFAKGRVPQLLRHEQDTADLVQLTWLRVLDKLDAIAVQAPGDFFAYLRAVLINALREALRRHGRAPLDRHLEAEAHMETLAASTVPLDDWLAYEQALGALELEQRTLILMRFEFGMSFPEIAHELGDSADAVRMRVNRAIARLAQGHVSAE
jgi:RNA polymerase sigma factor (sigma-70 family)